MEGQCRSEVGRWPYISAGHGRVCLLGYIACMGQIPQQYPCLDLAWAEGPNCTSVSGEVRLACFH